MRTFASLLAVAILLLAPTACTQGEGERCQIDEDCESGLVCGAAEGGVRVCRQPGTIPTADAEPPPNADAPGPVVDGSPIDAQVSPIDAATADADLTDADLTDAEPIDAAP